MKVLPFKIPKPQKSELIYQEDIGEKFYDQLHQHEEIQLSWVIKGEGELIVGERYSRYKAGDVICIGSNVPHLFRSDNSEIRESRMITIFFKENSFGEKFFQLHDFSPLKKLFSQLKWGIKIENGNEKLINSFKQFKKVSSINRFILFIELLDGLNRSKSTTLSSFVYQKQISEIEGRRMNDIMEFTFKNFSQEIALETVAKVAALTPNAFCRYFKKRTNKSYFQFLNEVRIENACRLLLVNRDCSVVEVSERVGFRNLSNFHRKFKQFKITTPLHFRKQQLSI